MVFSPTIGVGRDLSGLRIHPPSAVGGRYLGWAAGEADPVEEGRQLADKVARTPGYSSVLVAKDDRGKLIPLELDRALALLASALRKRNNPYFEVYLSKAEQWRRATPAWVLSQENLSELFGHELAHMDARSVYRALWNRFQAISNWADAKSVQFSEYEKLFVALFSFGSYVHYSRRKDRVASWPVWGRKKDSPKELKDRLLKELEGEASTKEPEELEGSLNFRQKSDPKPSLWREKVLPVVKQDAVAAGLGIAALATSLGLVALVDKMAKAREPVN